MSSVRHSCLTLWVYSHPSRQQRRGLSRDNTSFLTSNSCAGSEMAHAQPPQVPWNLFWGLPEFASGMSPGTAPAPANILEKSVLSWGWRGAWDFRTVRVPSHLSNCAHSTSPWTGGYAAAFSSDSPSQKPKPQPQRPYHCGPDLSSSPDTAVCP